MHGASTQPPSAPHTRPAGQAAAGQSGRHDSSEIDSWPQLSTWYFSQCCPAGHEVAVQVCQPPEVQYGEKHEAPLRHIIASLQRGTV